MGDFECVPTLTHDAAGGSGGGRETGHDGNAVADAIQWRSAPQRYSPVQERQGVRAPRPGDLPPATQRVDQHPDPYTPAVLRQRDIMRATYQGDDRCQLACPGCYTGDRLNLPLADISAAGGRATVTMRDFVDHVDALGDGMQDFYLLGAEATMDPEGSAAKLRHARERGWPQMVITHGATSVALFERTFGEALDSGMVYMLIISLDSMQPEVNNHLRGRQFAFQRTTAMIDHALARQAPVKVQMTVWPRNYATILDSVEKLYQRGVRGFAFHCGSLESSTATDARYGMDHVDPLAWRALAEQLHAFRQQHFEELWTFNVPWLFFTADELANEVIGDPALTESYREHVHRLEDGEESQKPVHACPALDAPQVYVYANDGARGRGQVSLCNIHADPDAGAWADFDPESKQWEVIADPEKNQMQAMVDSPHLCPATPFALRRGSDRFDTERGELFHGCRYLASNQVHIDTTQFGSQIYRDAVAFYRMFAHALDSYPSPDCDEAVTEWPLQRIQRVTAGIVPLAQRAAALQADLAAG